MSYSEWELLCISTDIEPGDTIEIENIYTGEKIGLIYKELSPNGRWIRCLTPKREKFTFVADTLDQKGKRTKQWRILGKSDFPLKIERTQTPHTPMKKRKPRHKASI